MRLSLRGSVPNVAEAISMRPQVARGNLFGRIDPERSEGSLKPRSFASLRIQFVRQRMFHPLALIGLRRPPKYHGGLLAMTKASYAI